MNTQEPKAPGPLAILVSADDNYAMPLAVTLFSALEHLGAAQEVNVYVLDGGISKKNRKRIENTLKKLPVILQLEWIRPDPAIISALPTPPLAYHSVVTNFRLLAPELVPERRVVYLDSDIIVNDDLTKIWFMDLEGCAVAAALDLNTPLDPTAPYFNAGVLLIDLEYWRRRSISAALIENLQKYQKVYMMNDQDALNAILQNNWVDFGLRWNAQINDSIFRASPIPVTEISIIHYTMNFKPWRWLGFGVVRPYYAQFFRVLERSRWFSPAEYLWFRTQLIIGFVSGLPNRVGQRLGQKSFAKSEAAN